MNIQFDRYKKFEDIQNDFSAMYPYLKLIFYIPGKAKPTAKQGLPNDIANITVGDVNADILPGSIETTDTMTIADLEKKFECEMGIAVKILRKSGNIWMETTITGSWTLARQNHHAAEISASRLF